MRRLAFQWAAIVWTMYANVLCGNAAETDVTGTAQVVLDRPTDRTIVGEMILLHFRAVLYHQPALEELHQPDLVDLNWKQLGRDVWTDIDIDGKPAYSFERTLAIFPQRTGRIIIQPFAYRVTLINRDNVRVTQDIMSSMIALDVDPLPAGINEQSWLPARTLKITSSWDMPSDRIPLGQVARRTITIEAAGVGPEQMPLPPKLRAPGVIAFAGPVTRTVELTQNGPVTRATYFFDVKPIDLEPATLPAITIAWFDTVNRVPRMAIVPEQRVSFLSKTERAIVRDRPSETTPMLGLIAVLGFVWGAAATMLWSRRGEWAEAARRAALLRPLKAAAAAGDAARFAKALSVLLCSNREAAGYIRSSSGMQQELELLDRYLYAENIQPSPNLGALCQMIMPIFKAAKNNRLRTGSRLVPIDGPWNGSL
jgi:hypothetical protein